MLSINQVPETTGKTPKKLAPGQRMCKINDITLADGYNHATTGAYDLILHLEGVDLGDDFEGFFIDKDNESLGRHKGQIGRVRASQFSFSDGQTKDGRKISRDLTILAFLKDLAKELGKVDELSEIQAATIEEYVPAAALILRGEDFIEYTIGGREWVDQKNYTNYDLYLPKFAGGKKPFVAEGNEAKLITYDAAVHIIKKKESKPVEKFESKTADFEM